MSADVHLALCAQRGDGLDGGFADDGTDLGLTVDILTYLATNLSVDSEYFCHCVVPFFVKGFDFSLLVLLACRHVHLPVCFERRGKSTGVAKNEFGDCGVKGR